MYSDTTDLRPCATPLFSADAIAQRVAALANDINSAFQGQALVVAPILKGGAMFGMDLVRQLELAVEIEFIRAKSYAGAHSSGTVEILQWPQASLSGKTVLLVEDILDTGRTTAALLDRVALENPARTALCVLLDKPSRRVTEVSAEFVGFTVDDYFMVGYGLDYEERYRALPAIYCMEERTSEKEC